MSSRRPAAPAMGEKLLAACGELWVINLPSRPDRRAEFSAQLARLGLSLDQKGDAPQAHLFAAVQPAEPGAFPGIGARGCFLSHLGVLRQARDSGLERLLICEDDLDFSEALVDRGEAALARIAREDWAIFYGFPPAGIPPPPAGAAELIALAPGQEMLCSHFVAFRRPAIEALIPYLEAMLARPPGDPEGGPMHIDGAYNWFRRSRPDLRVLAAAPALGSQRSSRSDISAPTLKDRLPLVRALVRHARRLRNRLAPRSGA